MLIPAEEWSAAARNLSSTILKTAQNLPYTLSQPTQGGKLH